MAERLITLTEEHLQELLGRAVRNALELERSRYLRFIGEVIDDALAEDRGRRAPSACRHARGRQ